MFLQLYVCFSCARNLYNYVPMYLLFCQLTVTVHRRSKTINKRLLKHPLDTFFQPYNNLNLNFVHSVSYLPFLLSETRVISKRICTEN